MAIGDPEWLKPDPPRVTEWCVAAIPCGIFGYGIEKLTEESGKGIFVIYIGTFVDTANVSGTFGDGIADKRFSTEMRNMFNTNVKIETGKTI